MAQSCVNIGIVKSQQEYSLLTLGDRERPDPRSKALF